MDADDPTNAHLATPPPPVSRWSDAKYTNLEVPCYIPAEAFTCMDGHFLRALRLRAVVHDLQRLIATDSCDAYFSNIPITPAYDNKGQRTNTPRNMVSDKRLSAITELGSLLSIYDDRHAVKGKEILRKVRFTKEQMDTGAWGAVIGARGAVHQSLEKEYHCRIVLAGRGITDPMKDSNFNAAAWASEDPHVRITATNEQDLQAVVERIEWILSDDPEAEEFREANRRRTAQVEGRYDPRTWVSSADLKKASGTAASGVGEKRPREEEEKDEELANFLEEFE